MRRFYYWALSLYYWLLYPPHGVLCSCRQCRRTETTIVTNKTLIGMTYRRGGHSFLFIIAPELKQDALRLMGKRAADPDDPFTWQDAANCCRRLRESTIGERKPCREN